MQIYIVDDSQSAADLAAEHIIEAVETGARHLGLATGQTMVPVYRSLVERCQNRRQDLSIADWQTFNLDEYVSLAAGHVGSFHHFMQTHLFEPLGLSSSQTHLLDGMASDLTAECADYERRLAASGLDLQLLGLGINGHIGFNEPGTPWDSRTHVVSLSAETMAQNGPDFPGVMPERALTMGMESIMQARKILTVATGASKAPALLAAILGPKTPSCPASALQRHAHARFIIDREAAALLIAEKVMTHPSVEVIEVSTGSKRSV